jgi:hypothetical protein
MGVLEVQANRDESDVVPVAEIYELHALGVSGMRRRLLDALWVLCYGYTYTQREAKLEALKRIYAQMTVEEKRVLGEQKRMWN